MYYVRDTFEQQNIWTQIIQSFFLTRGRKYRAGWKSILKLASVGAVYLIKVNIRLARSTSNLANPSWNKGSWRGLDA